MKMTKVEGIRTLMVMVACSLLFAEIARGSIFECGFETSESYSTGTIDGQNSWNKSGSGGGGYADVANSTYTDWGGRTGDQFLIVDDYTVSAYTPYFDTSGDSTVVVSFDIRPGGSSNPWGYGARFTVQNSSDQYMIEAGFKRTAATSGCLNINGTDTALTWAYVDKDTVLHVQMTINQGAAWNVTAKIDDQSEVTVALKDVSAAKSAAIIQLRGASGISGYANAACYDELSVIPEPATCLMLGVGSLALLQRRKKRQ